MHRKQYMATVQSARYYSYTSPQYIATVIYRCERLYGLTDTDAMGPQAFKRTNRFWSHQDCYEDVVAKYPMVC